MEKYRKCETKSSKGIEVDDEEISESESENENMGIGRTYECNYCKRGFTNAQALGGHMNIHRKDKAKARQQQPVQHLSIFSSSSSCSSYNNNKPVVMEPPISAYNSSSFAPPPPPRSYPQGVGYYPFPNNNPSFSSQSSIFEGNRTCLYGMYDEDHHLGADLSLRISSSSNADDQYRQGDRPTLKNNNKEEGRYNDIDLELRLGYDP